MGIEKDEAVIYLAGGCFWGLEKYISGVQGVRSTQAGYANGKTRRPTYLEVCRGDGGFAEAVRVAYDADVCPLPFLLDVFYDAIDPTSVNRQGPDSGIQYRTGVYFENDGDREAAEASLRRLAARYDAPLAVECGPLRNFYPAEEYHQKYLDKNPGGYCHIGGERIARAAGRRPEPEAYPKPGDAALRERLTPLQYEVTQNSATEPPFQNEYWDRFEPGIYVDITTGEPLFSSSDKFDSGCGWPSFSRPVSPERLSAFLDKSHGMERTEVRSKSGGAHLGHVFNDGPKNGPAADGLRYCINSASLRFIARDRMEAEGYGDLLGLVE